MVDSIKKDLDIINKKFGKGSIQLAETAISEDLEVISTGSYGLDFKLGVGGFPRGRVIEITGLESVSKTTLAAHVCANAQKMGGLAAFIDAEHEVDLKYFKNLGINTKELAFSQPDDMEQGLAILETLVEMNKFDVVVFDSIAQASTKAEIEGTIEDKQMADKARLMGKHLRRITPILRKTKTVVIFINQVRDSVNIYAGKASPGGKALRYKSAIRLELRKVADTVRSGDKTGIRVAAKIVKNKVGPPLGLWEYQVEFGKGIQGDLDLVELGIQQGIIQKGGSWFSYEGESIGQGIFNTAEYIANNIPLKEKILSEVFKSNEPIEEPVEEIIEKQEPEALIEEGENATLQYC